MSFFLRQLMNSLGTFFRTIRAFFVRRFTGVTAKFRQFTNFSRNATKAATASVQGAAAAMKKPSAREDYIETQRLFISKSFLVLLAVGLVAVVLLAIFVVWPFLLSHFFTARFWQEDKRVPDWTGRVIVYADKAKRVPLYSGRLEKGVLQGDGKEYDQDGLLAYEGPFVDGLRSGKGACYQGGVLVYEGQLLAGVYEGSGRLFQEGELVYEGAFSGGEANGAGAAYADGALIYQGNFQDGLYQGAGEAFYPSGAVAYRGSFSQGAYEGEGTSYREDGSTLYKGGFTAGLYEGEGTLYLDGNQRIQAEFSGGTPAGTIQWYRSGRLWYDGESDDLTPDGFGTIYAKSGKAVYAGEMDGGTLDGAWLLTLAAEDLRAAFGEAAVTETDGVDGFYIVNEDLGLTALCSYQQGEETPQVYQLWLDPQAGTAGEGLLPWKNMAEAELWALEGREETPEASVERGAILQPDGVVSGDWLQNWYGYGTYTCTLLRGDGAEAPARLIWRRGGEMPAGSEAPVDESLAQAQEKLDALLDVLDALGTQTIPAAPSSGGFGSSGSAGSGSGGAGSGGSDAQPGGSSGGPDDSSSGGAGGDGAGSGGSDAQPGGSDSGSSSGDGPDDGSASGDSAGDDGTGSASGDSAGDGGTGSGDSAGGDGAGSGGSDAQSGGSGSGSDADDSASGGSAGGGGTGSGSGGSDAQPGGSGGGSDSGSGSGSGSGGSAGDGGTGSGSDSSDTQPGGSGSGGGSSSGSSGGTGGGGTGSGGSDTQSGGSGSGSASGGSGGTGSSGGQTGSGGGSAAGTSGAPVDVPSLLRAVDTPKDAHDLMNALIDHYVYDQALVALEAARPLDEETLEEQTALLERGQTTQEAIDALQDKVDARDRQIYQYQVLRKEAEYTAQTLTGQSIADLDLSAVLWLMDAREIDAAALYTDAEAYTLAVAEDPSTVDTDQLALDIKRQVLDLTVAYDNVEAARHTLERTRSALEQSTQLYAKGSLERSALYDAQGAVSDAAAAMIQTAGAFTSQFNRLNYLSGGWVGQRYGWFADPFQELRDKAIQSAQESAAAKRQEDEATQAAAQRQEERVQGLEDAVAELKDAAKQAESAAEQPQPEGVVEAA